MTADIGIKAAAGIEKLDKILEKGNLRDAYKQLNDAQRDLNKSTRIFEDQLKGIRKQSDRFNISLRWYAANKELISTIKETKEWIQENDQVLIKQRQLQEQAEEYHERIKDFISEKSKWLVGLSLGFAGLIANSMDELRAQTVAVYGIASPAIKGLASATQESYLRTVQWGMATEDVIDVYQTLSKQLGTVDPKIIKGLADDALLFKSALDLSSEESIGLSRLLQKQGLTAQKGYEIATRAANKFGVSVKNVLADVASISDELQSWDYETLIKSSAAANSLGLNLGEALQSLEKFEDLGSAIEAQNISALYLGGKFNAQLLMEKALQGDVAGYAEHIKEAINGTNFDAMPRALRKTVAAQFGVTQSQFSTFSKMTKEEISNLKKQGEMQGEINKLTDLANQKMTALRLVWAQLKAATIEVLEPLATGFGKFVTWITRSTTQMEGMKKVMKGVVYGLIAFTTAWIGIKALKITGTILDITGALAKWATGTKAVAFWNTILGKSMATTAGPTGMLSIAGAGKFAMAIGIIAVAFLALGGAIALAGIGIEKMKGFSFDEVKALGALIPVLTGIGIAATAAATGLGLFSLAAIPATLAAIPLAALGPRKEQTPQIDYDRMKSAFKEAIQGMEVVAKLDGNIVSDVTIDDTKIGKVLFKSINKMR